jgi:SAM-dependent methyltransferase
LNGRRWKDSSVPFVSHKHESLRILRVHGGDSLAKTRAVVVAYPTIWHGTILDVGCRDQALGRALDAHSVEYVGLDIRPPADVVADLDDGIPMADGAVDVVVALDVLEHTNAIHFAFDEVCRVARHHVVIALPNQYELHDRWQTVRGRNRSGKFGLPLNPPDDRHRWLFPFDEARTFCRHRARAAGWRVVEEAVMIGRRRRLLEPLVRAWPTLLAPDLVTHLVPSSARS